MPQDGWGRRTTACRSCAWGRTAALPAPAARGVHCPCCRRSRSTSASRWGHSCCSIHAKHACDRCSFSYSRRCISLPAVSACAEGGQPSFSRSRHTRRSSALMAVLFAAELPSGDAQRHAHERPLPGLRLRLLQLRRQLMPGLPSRWVHIGFTF